jgi:hypothetical protein
VGTTGVGNGVAVGAGVGTGVGDGVGSTGLNTGFGDSFGAALIATPLFQTSFVPDLTQVNFLPADIDVVPAFVHFAPALTAANDGAAIRDRDIRNARNSRGRVIAQRYQSVFQDWKD